MKRVTTLFVLIFLFSSLSHQVNGILNPEFDADQSSGRQIGSSYVEIVSLTLNNNVVVVGDVINLTAEVDSSGCPFGDCDEYRWYLNSTGEEIDECSGVGSDYRQCTFNSTSQHIGIISVAVQVTNQNTAEDWEEIIFEVWNHDLASSTSASGIEIQYDIIHLSKQTFAIQTWSEIDTTPYESIQLDGYVGTYSAVAALEYRPSMSIPSDSVWNQTIEVSISKNLGATSLWYVNGGGMWVALSLSSIHVDATTEKFTYAAPENTPAIPVGHFVLIGGSVDAALPPDATISGFQAFQSDDYGSISISWDLSGVFFSSDMIMLTVCPSTQISCSNSFEIEPSATRGYTYPGTLTSHGETYYLRIEVCNEVGCSIPIGEAYVQISKEKSLEEQCVTHDDLVTHFHSYLYIEMQGEDVFLPENIGINTAACPGGMHVIHTHAADNKLHVETTEYGVRVYLSQFFDIWNISFPTNQTFDDLFNHAANVTVVVNGESFSGSFEELELLDNQIIEITYLNNDLDSDGDGVPDHDDSFPFDSNETSDSDGDGVGDNSDAFPDDPNETHDDDSDGVGNNTDAFPQDNSETHDDDGDGVGNNSDAFPQDSNETMDSDGDGVGDNADPEPENPEIRTPQDISVEISDTSSYILAGAVVFLALVIIFVRRKAPPQVIDSSVYVSQDSMWNDEN